MNVLVINAGSSSLKYQLLNPATGALLAKGLCERIGIDGKFTYKPQLEGKEAIKAADVAMPTHNEAIAAVLNALVDEKNGVIGSMKEIDAVGHRVVHGGEKFAKSVVITDEVMAAIEECNPLAPLHNPANIIGIKACQQLMPGVPMVAVFDTAFHQTMPPVAYTYAIPYEYYENDKVRRYGFHGTSSQVCGLPRRRYARQAHREPEAHLLPPRQRLLRHRCGRRQERGDLHGLYAPRRPAHGHPRRRHRRRYPGVPDEQVRLLHIGEMLNILNKKSGMHGHLRRFLRLPRSGGGR